MNIPIENKLTETGGNRIGRFAHKIGFQHLLKQLPRSLLALAFALGLSAFMTAMQAVTDNRAIAAGLHRQADDPLPDLLMDWGGSRFIPMYTADLLLNSLIALTIVCFLLSWRWRVRRYGTEEGHYRTLRMARKFLWMLGFAYLFRSFSLLSTTMPPTDPRCIYKQRNWKQIPFMHSSMATLVCLFWLGALLRPDSTATEPAQQAPVPLWRKLAAGAIVAWTGSIYIFCVLCRNHYSIDIIVAILVCTGIFSTFQLCLKVIELGQLNALVSLSNPSSKNESALALPNWPQTQHHYSPLTNDPEVGLDSPQILMTEIKQLEDVFKPPSRSSVPLKHTGRGARTSYVPRAFLLLLRAVSWMDGIDLKP